MVCTVVFSLIVHVVNARLRYGKHAVFDGSPLRFPQGKHLLLLRMRCRTAKGIIRRKDERCRCAVGQGHDRFLQRCKGKMGVLIKGASR